MLGGLSEAGVSNVAKPLPPRRVAGRQNPGCSVTGPAMVRAAAPARINIIGEHTDYNDGLVLPMNTALYTTVRATRREDRSVHASTATLGEQADFNLGETEATNGVGWISYVEGVVAGLEERGLRLEGANLDIDSNIPLGAGLSSSASLELAVARALLGLMDADVPADELALLCQRAEHDYAGVQCGIMDQYSLACARAGNALLLDCRSLTTRQVPLAGDFAFILTDSGVRHSHSGGGYNDRAQECAAAVDVLAAFNEEFESLRDLDAETLEAHREALGEVLYKRCRHVFTESLRVENMVQALETGDLAAAGELLNACHESLRDDFEISCPEVDALVDAANACNAVLGSRMVGGGFGGCVLSVTTQDVAADAARDIADWFAQTRGNAPWQHLVTPAPPARLLGDCEESPLG